MRMIDKDEAIKILCDGCTADCDVPYTVCITVQKIIDMPTIEPEVRHGKLLEGKTFNDQHCSVCGQKFRDDIGFIIQGGNGEFHYPKRCHECGCYWDGGAEDG